MKNQEALLNNIIITTDILEQLDHDEIGDDHLYTGYRKPL